MIEFDGKIKKWGNSMGIVIPKKMLKGKIRPNTIVKVIISPGKDNETAAAIWGLMRGWKISVNELEEWIYRAFEKMDNVEFVK